MGDTPLGATSWVDAGHRVGRLARSMLDAEHAFVVVSESGRSSGRATSCATSAGRSTASSRR